MSMRLGFATTALCTALLACGGLGEKSHNKNNDPAEEPAPTDKPDNPPDDVPDNPPTPTGDYGGTLMLTQVLRYDFGVPVDNEWSGFANFYLGEKLRDLDFLKGPINTCYQVAYPPDIVRAYYHDAGDALTATAAGPGLATPFELPAYQWGKEITYEGDELDGPGKLEPDTYTVSWPGGPSLAAGRTSSLVIPDPIFLLSPVLYDPATVTDPLVEQADTWEVWVDQPTVLTWEPGTADHFIIMVDIDTGYVVCDATDDGAFEIPAFLIPPDEYFETWIFRMNEREDTLPDGSKATIYGANGFVVDFDTYSL